MAVQDDERAFNRESILQTLWGDPIAGVVGHDVPLRLQRGEEYLDLQRLEFGVQVARANMSPTGGELSRKAVRAATWDKLLVQLPSHGVGRGPMALPVAAPQRSAGVPPPLPPSRPKTRTTR